MKRQRDLNKTTAIYFDENYEFYSTRWSREHLHYGFWFHDTKSHEDSLINHIKIVADELNIEPKCVILDSGCGTGGTSRYLANNFDVTVFGITMSDVMLNAAIDITNNHSFSNRVRFEIRDFCNTGFPSECFDRIIAIESSCYAVDKKRFFEESFRIMKKNGKLVISDAFLLKDKLNDKEEIIYKEFLDGWAIPNFLTINDFYQGLMAAGFSDVKYTDQLKYIRKSSQLIYQGAEENSSDVFNMVVDNKIPVSRLKHIISQYRQKECIDMGIWTHGRFVAVKL